MTNEIIIKAIQKINSTAEVSVSGGDINSIVWHNETTPIPIADIQAQIPIVEQEIADEKTNKETRKATAKQKLIDLGLTTEEIKALTGV